MELDEMEEDLKSFGVLKSEKRKHERLKATIYRVRNSVTVVFDKERHEKRLTKLRESTMDIHTLRIQTEELLKKRSNTSSPSQLRKRLPHQYSSVQKVSQTLHEALSNAWVCPYTGHKTHYGRLCVEAQVQDMVRLDLALSYKPYQHNTDSNTRNEKYDDHVWVYVQSSKIQTTSVGPMQEKLIDTISPYDGLASALYLNQTDADSSLTFQRVTQS
ncbi:hypothetical protein N7457_005435 [Penicillium paradoxum]|uniref:uncharacterized protein n=1 Tax=Penicillium paradoxum TaxID=176176 RepID=UPI002549A669|nr:uncharacterized protein N7457_005435 [Penicillium paradoxum]KAJ5780275.1 hypothetical protein N7457_005435 [Penicillium paradoxum]